MQGHALGESKDQFPPQNTSKNAQERRMYCTLLVPLQSTVTTDQQHLRSHKTIATVAPISCLSATLKSNYDMGGTASISTFSSWGDGFPPSSAGGISEAVFPQEECTVRIDEIHDD